MHMKQVEMGLFHDGITMCCKPKEEGVHSLRRICAYPSDKQLVLP